MAVATFSQLLSAFAEPSQRSEVLPQIRATLKDQHGSQQVVPFAMKLLNQNIRLLSSPGTASASRQKTPASTHQKTPVSAKQQQPSAQSYLLESCYEALNVLRQADWSWGDSWDMEKAHFNVIQKTLELGLVQGIATAMLIDLRSVKKHGMNY